MKPVPGPVEGWTFGRNGDGRPYAELSVLRNNGTRAHIVVCAYPSGLRVDADHGMAGFVPLAVVRALIADEALTVGQALADARVQGGTHVIVADCPIWGWTQICVDGGHIAWRLCDSGPDGDEFVAWDREWETDEFPIGLLSLPCRIVEDADAPPESRGSL